MNNKKALILIVDDDENNRLLLEAVLKPENYKIASVGSGEAALEIVKKQLPDLILLDVLLTGMDGYTVAQKLKSNYETLNIPIIMLTSLNDEESRLKGLKSGAEEFISKPVNNAELRIRVRNMLRLKEFNNFLDKHNRVLEDEVNARTQELRDSNIETIFTLTKAVERRDEDSGSHVRRISHYCQYLAQALKMQASYADAIFYASPMHDIGKIGIPDKVLLKPGKHTLEETNIMKTHSMLGAEILENTKSPFLKMGADIARNHHERWDGTGYPKGISGMAIPLSARIMTICDVYDALRSKRSYKPAFSHTESVEIILKGDGRTMPGHFDPDVLQAFTEGEAYFEKIYQNFMEQKL